MQKFTRLHKNNIFWKPAPDVKKRLLKLTSSIGLSWVTTSRVFCLRSENAKTRAIARIWGLSRIWQDVLGVTPAYIIEVISEKYDRLTELEKDKVLLHEINHIPRNFSGALAPHIRRGPRSFHKKLEILVAQYLRNLK